MASTITAGTLTVKLTETIALNGTNMDATNTLTVNSINEIKPAYRYCTTSRFCVFYMSSVL